MQLGAMPTVQPTLIPVSPEIDAKAGEFVDRLVKTVRGDRPALGYFQRRRLRPIQTRVATRIAAKQFPLFSEADFLEIYRIARG